MVWMFEDSVLPPQYGSRLETDPAGRMTSCEWIVEEVPDFDPRPVCRSELAARPIEDDSYADLARNVGGSVEKEDAVRIVRGVGGGR